MLCSATVTLASTSVSRFRIPGTAFLLHIVSFLDTPIHRGALGRAILHGQEKARRHMNTHEDSYLWPQDEPFLANDTNTAAARVFVDIESFDSFDRSDKRLRYSSTASVLQGLWIFMYVGRREAETVFHVEEGRQGLVVGFGKVYALGEG
ncbi:MAG: hypothetical protein Q9195_003516 [Heterodermia aff. obscurata]